MRHYLYRVLLLIVSLIPGYSHAQDSSVEFWPEMDLWLRISPKWRASLFVPLSKNLETKYREGSLILQADYAFGRTRYIHIRRLFDDSRSQTIKRFLIRGGYQSARSLDDRGEAYNEDMVFLELHARIPLKKQFLLSHRLRSEARWIGDDNDFSTRFRYRFQAEKEFQINDVSLVPYVNVEPYYDSRYETVNRVRAIGGATVTWMQRFAIEGNFTYQYDSRSSVTNLYALNLILHIYFETKYNKRKASEN